MAQPEWTRLFQIEAKKLKQGDSWRLEYDESIVPDRPNLRWKQHNTSTCARFKCTKCGRGWISNRIKVVFHMRLTYGQGNVKVRPFRQNCKMCDGAPMEKPSITADNISILMENLVEKIRIKCYNEDLGTRKRHFRSVDVKSPHEPAHCEACMGGFCTRK